MRKGSPHKEKLNKCLALHDSGVSKKKFHLFRNLDPTSVPTRDKLNAAQKALNAKVLETFDTMSKTKRRSTCFRRA